MDQDEEKPALGGLVDGSKVYLPLEALRQAIMSGLTAEKSEETVARATVYLAFLLQGPRE